MRVAGVQLDTGDLAWLERACREPGSTRSGLARGLCERLELVDDRGRRRVVSARIDLTRHAQAGRISLPEPCDGPPRARWTRAVEGTRAAGDRRTLEQLGSLTVRLVRGRSDPAHAVWTSTLQEQHYLGAGPLCGAQLRYVVRAGDEVVAAASFSSAALKLAARDRFIGWSPAARTRHRPRVIAQSRFCVAVPVQNLASCVQALLLARIADDWEERHGIRPVLVESCVDTTRFRGTSYRAANWTYVGETQGRGRQDRRHEARQTIKSVWIYPLDAGFRDILCLEPVRRLDPTADWAETEWGGVDLRDRRLTRRLVALGRARAERPTANLPQSCGSRAATKAAYRLLNHSQASLDRFLSEHRETTLARAAEHPVILAIQDTTTLNYTAHHATTGLGPIGTCGAHPTMGLMVHATLLSNPQGTPLGVLDLAVWARDAATFGAKKDKRRPTAEKESRKWLDAYAAIDAAAKRLDEARVVSVGDCEADMFDLFDVASKGKADLLVRARHPRRILTAEGDVEGSVWETLAAEPVQGELTVEIPRSGSKPARVVGLELRSREVRISSPADRPGKRHAVRMWAIAATEGEVTRGNHEPVEWLLLTTLPIESALDAAEKVRWYHRRWGIEVYFRTLKSGCKIEDRQSTTAESLEAALAIDAVVAWRVLWLTKLGRETPDVPCTIFFDDVEWKALCCFVAKNPKPPDEPPSLKTALRMVATLGGFLGRKGDGEPGAETTWRGLERLTDIAATARIFFSSA